MKTEHVNSTAVRHQWKRIVEGLAQGKVYIVETFGRPEAVVMSPKRLKAKGPDLAKHFSELAKEPAVPLSRVEITRSPEL